MNCIKPRYFFLKGHFLQSHSYRGWLVLAVFIAGLGLWHFTQPASHASGKLENQIRGFGPQLTAALAPNSTFELTTGGYQPKPEPPQPPAGLKPEELQAWTAMARRQSGPPALIPIFPAHYSAGTEVRGLGMSVTLKPLGSRAAPAKIENGKLVYYGAYQSTDIMQVVRDSRSEEFLFLHDLRAPQRFEYEITQISGVKDISLRDKSIHFKNAHGQHLQIEAPWLIESGGRKMANSVHWELSYPHGQIHPRLALVVSNATKLKYPVVIDPTWAVTSGNLNTARQLHTSTLLPNGQVLVAGGYNGGYLASAELYNPTTGTWTTTGSLNTARHRHTATLLSSGQVLIAGGYNGSYLASAELYNPTTGTWTTTGSLNTSRQGNTATLLPNGQVLVAGGFNGSIFYMATVELFDPSTGTWTATGNLNFSRGDHTATLLPGGKVLVAGGYSFSSGGSQLGSAEIFDSATGAWTITGSLNTVREDHIATLLSDGQVLVAGGYNRSLAYLGSSELYNPTTGIWTITGNLNAARQYHAATLLPNGQVLVAGGENGSYLDSTEYFNPATGTWSAVGGLNTARREHTATLLPNCQVLIVGGRNTNSYTASTELVTPANGSWTNTSNLTTARYYHTATLLPNGQVLVAGGRSYSDYLTSAELYNPISGTWTVTGNLNIKRAFHTATLLSNGWVLVAGGGAPNLNSAELYNPTTGAWTLTGNLNTARQYHTASLLPNGQVLVSGGMNSFSLNSSELYDPVTGIWTSTGNLNFARLYHTATLLPNGKVLVVGGNNAAVRSAELYNPATGTWIATGNLISNRYNHTATLLPNGRVLVAAGFNSQSAELYDSDTGVWTATGGILASRTKHTATLLSDGQVMITAGIRSGYLNTADLYNPLTGIWKKTGNLNIGREFHTATLLPSGKVLVSGGSPSTFQPSNSAELFDPGFCYNPSNRPQLNAVSSANTTLPLSLSGTNFSNGTNTPVVQLQSLANEQVINVPLDSSYELNSTSVTTHPPTGLVPGFALLTMLVDGYPSVSHLVTYSLTDQSIPNFPSVRALGLTSSPFALPITASSGLPVTYSVVTGPATVVGNTLTLNGTGTVILQATQAGNGTYAPFLATQTITVKTGFDIWMDAYTVSDSSPTSKPQNDGVSNLLKYLYNIDPSRPMNAMDRAAMPAGGPQPIGQNTYLTLTYRRNTLATDVVIEVQTSIDLVNWETVIPDIGPEPIGADTLTGDPIIQVGAICTNIPKMFIRLKIIAP
jgi:N-acetylneuraminic acid mutarotase